MGIREGFDRILKSAYKEKRSTGNYWYYSGYLYGYKIALNDFNCRVPGIYIDEDISDIYEIYIEYLDRLNNYYIDGERP